MPNLQNLNMRKCPIFNFINNQSNFINIRSLDLSHNKLVNQKPGMFGIFPNLQSLNLENGEFKLIPDVFDGLGNLETLSLEGNQLIEIYGEFFNPLINLKSLNLTYSSREKNGYDCWYPSCTYLCQKLNPNVFNGLENLESISLRKNFIDYIDMEIFRPLRNLKRLNLSLNKLTLLVPDMFRCMPYLADLDLSNNELLIKEDTFCHLKRLKKLDLSYNSLRSSTLSNGIFSCLESLEVLKLSGNKIEKINGSMFKGLDSLKVLSIQIDHLEIDKDSFLSMKNLEKVYLCQDVDVKRELTIFYPNIVF